MAVVEVGIDNKGDMLLHSQLVQPDICVMTSIGEEHLRQLGSIEGVFDEEKILAENCLANGGNCFFPEADEWLKKIKSTNQNAQIFYTPSKVELLVPNVDLKDFSAIMQQNAALAISVAMHLGMTKEEIKENVKLLKIPMGRGSAYECRAQCWILEDHYNANPSSLVKSLTNAILFSQNKNLPLTVILGDMLDLGSDSEKKHKQIWDEVIQNQKIKKAVLIGPEWGKFKNSKSNFETEFFISSDQASKKVISTLPKQGVFLFKGSRGMALEKVLDKFKELK
jgi:UDP-N-acetylmuramyl pentapeptide synthase